MQWKIPVFDDMIINIGKNSTIFRNFNTTDEVYIRDVRVGSRRRGANLSVVELNRVTDMERGLRGGANFCLYRGSRLKMVQYMRLDS